MPYRTIPAECLENLLLSRRGLTAGEVAVRQRQFGANDIVEGRPSTWIDLVRDTARDPMIWFLLAVSFLYAGLGEYVEALTLLAALVPLAGMDAYLHRRTQASTKGLASRLAATAKVLRDGTTVEIPARDVVPGDLAVVGPGETFPADGVILSGAELQAEESVLTGEAFPVRKQPLGQTSVEQGMIDTVHWVFAGTRLLTGEANVRVAYTGGETLYGEIVRSAVSGAHARTPLQRAIGELVAIMLAVAVIMCIALAVIRVIQGHGLVDAALSAVTLAVAALPEEFPVVFTFFLGVGVYRLARRQALVRRAVAVENIGRITCICSDKTGTLTEGKLALAHAFPAEGVSVERLVQLASLAARRDNGDPLDAALIDAAQPGERFQHLAEFPFTEDRRRETAVLKTADGSYVAVVKGAPETVLPMCGDKAAVQAVWREHVDAYASTGHKVIACATRPLDQTAWAGGEPDRGYTFAGLVAFEDRLREGVREAVAACQEARIRVIMVTGDHPETAKAIGRDLGLGTGQPVVATAEAFGTGSDHVSADLLRRVDIVARAAPSQKLGLVRALQQAGEIVAVTGDGVNDVPALQAADIGIAMGERGTRSAREVAAIVLLDDNFRTIVRAISEGRQLFRNLQLSFAYLLMVHIPLVLSAALVPLAGFPLLYLPVHIVWLELIIHPTALLVFQGLPTSDRLMRAERDGPPHFFRVRAWFAIGMVGLLVTGVVTVGYHYALGAAQNVEHARAMALTALVVASATITAALSGLRNRAAWIVVLGSLASLPVFVQYPALAVLVHLAPLHLSDWMIAAAGGTSAGLVALLASAIIRGASRRHDLQILA